MHKLINNWASRSLHFILCICWLSLFMTNWSLIFIERCVRWTNNHNWIQLMNLINNNRLNENLYKCLYSLLELWKLLFHLLLLQFLLLKYLLLQFSILLFSLLSQFLCLLPCLLILLTINFINYSLQFLWIRFQLTDLLH